jgi:hypothetical protein
VKKFRWNIFLLSFTLLPAEYKYTSVQAFLFSDRFWRVVTMVHNIQNHSFSPFIEVSSFCGAQQASTFSHMKTETGTFFPTSRFLIHRYRTMGKAQKPGNSEGSLFSGCLYVFTFSFSMDGDLSWLLSSYPLFHSQMYPVSDRTLFPFMFRLVCLAPTSPSWYEYNILNTYGRNIFMLLSHTYIYPPSARSSTGLQITGRHYPQHRAVREVVSYYRRAAERRQVPFVIQFVDLLRLEFCGWVDVWVFHIPFTSLV